MMLIKIAFNRYL